MIPRIPLHWLAPALCLALLVGCGLPGAATAPTAGGDAVATQVAIARAVAATLTAAVPAAIDAPAELPTPTVAAATEPPTDVPPAPTVALAPTLPEVIAPATQTAVPDEPLPDALAPGGNASNVVGGIVVPSDARITDYSQGNNLEVAFKSPLWFSVLAYVPSNDGKDKDGAGIKEVRIQITGPTASGENGTVHEQPEHNAAFCVFGNDKPACNAWDFAAHDNKWPGGESVQYGENYHVQINIDGQDGQNNASWNFNFTIEAPQ